VTNETTTLLTNAVPLLVAAVLYLALSALLLRSVLGARRRPPTSGLALWLLFAVIGLTTAVLGGAKLGDSEPLASSSPWPAFALTLLILMPAFLLLARRDRELLVDPAGRLRAAEEAASEREREVGAMSRLSSALSRSLSARDASENLFDELEHALGVEAALLAVVDDAERRATGFAARGADEDWWKEVEIDLVEDPGGIATVARERAAFAVYDVEAAPHLSRALDTVPAKSAAFLPLISEGRLTGVLVVAVLSERRFFAAGELELFQRLANETALALGRSRSSEALEAALERERLVAAISRQVRSELDLDDVLTVAVRETARALGVSRCFIRLVEPGGAMPIHSEWTAPGHDPVGGAAARLPASNLAARLRRTVAIADVESSSELDNPDLGGRETLVGLGTKAVLATPILVFDDVIGVFALHRSEVGRWTEGEIALAEAVAGEAGLAIHTARLLREEGRRVDRQSALLKAAQVVTSDLRFTSVLQRLVEEVAELLGADAADCWILEPHRDSLRCRAVFGLPEAAVGRRLPAAGTHKAALEGGKPVLTRNFRETEEPPPSAYYSEFEDVMVAPITWLGEVRGLLGICSVEAGRFGEADLELLDAYARFASLAFHNAESFEERERQAQIQQGFYRIAEALGSPLSLDETVTALAQAATEALGGIAAFVLRAAGDKLLLVGSYDVRAEVEAALRDGIQYDEAPLSAATREGRLVTSSSLSEDERFHGRWRELLNANDACALLAASVEVTSGEPGSVVVLFREERAFTDDDLALARHLSRAARGALERSELFETERRGRRLSQRLAAIGARVVTVLDPSVVLEEIVREAPVLLDADAATVRLLDGEELVIRAASGVEGDSAHDLVGTRADVGTGLLGDAVQSRAPATLDDVDVRPDLGHGDPLLLRGMTGCIAVPMIAHGGGLHGVLSVYSERPRAWREEEAQALSALAAVASAGLSNAELYQRVAEEKERSNAILLNIADGIVAVDREEHVVLWNAMAERITGVPAAEALGRRIADVLQRDLAGAARGHGREEPVTISRGGKDVFLSLTEAVMLDPGGGVGGRIFAFRDVSGERVVDQMKSDFVATVSHELRTPLTSIYGFAETLLRSDVAFGDEERVTFLGYIASESERLIGIVDDLLSVARLEAGTLGLDLAPVDVAEVLGSVGARAQEHIDGSHRLEVDAPDSGLYAEADGEKLAQILLHLVDNAVKYSPEGGTITLAGRRKTDAIEVRVSDEGIGIPIDDQSRIFTKFYRAGTAPLTGAHGTGLGLFLVRGLLAAMDGRIAVESVEGEGSTFVFELPVSKSAGQGREAQVEQAGHS
jgi:two-component system, OmpR family, phosphate regulon sensor histidine kinase PhoR